MPVLITGAETAEGVATARRLVRTGEVRAFVDADNGGAAETLRNLGCKVARGSLDDEGHLEAALEQVHSVIHVAGGPLTVADEVLDGAATVMSAAIGAGCRRMIYVSHVGAGDPRGNAYLAACAEVETMLADAPLEAITIRRTLTYGPGDPLTEALAAGAVPAEAAEATHSPLYVDDLALVIAEADRVRGNLEDLHVQLTLSGPMEILLGSFADLLASPAPPARPTVLPPAVADLLARDLVTNDGLTGPTRIPEGLERLARD
jgi:uncharacterized protein YbjT (DUF2867 family)